MNWLNNIINRIASRVYFATLNQHTLISSLRRLEQKETLIVEYEVSWNGEYVIRVAPPLWKYFKKTLEKGVPINTQVKWQRQKRRESKW